MKLMAESYNLVFDLESSFTPMLDSAFHHNIKKDFITKIQTSVFSLGGREEWADEYSTLQTTKLLAEWNGNGNEVRNITKFLVCELRGFGRRSI
jgi:hypothetical protein